MKRVLVIVVSCALLLVGCGKKGFATGAPPGTPANSVVEKFGEPDQKPPTPPFLHSLKPAECASKERITFAWIYSPRFYDHAVIYFDAERRVVCVTEGGVYFMVHV